MTMQPKKRMRRLSGNKKELNERDSKRKKRGDFKGEFHFRALGCVLPNTVSANDVM